MGLVGRVFGRDQIAGIGIEGFEQSVQCAVCHVADAGLDYIIALDLVQDFLIHAHLAIGSITLRACAHTAQSKSPKEDDNDKQYGNRKNSALKTLRHGKTRQLGADSRIILQPEGWLLDYPRCDSFFGGLFSVVRFRCFMAILFHCKGPTPPAGGPHGCRFHVTILHSAIDQCLCRNYADSPESGKQSLHEWSTLWTVAILAVFFILRVVLSCGQCCWRQKRQ